jgi:hypothetical protein
MTDPRHRRHVSRRTTVIGVLLALALAVGALTAFAAGDGALRPMLGVVLVIAVAAGVLALDEARVVGARMSAELSRERAHRTRDLQEAHQRIADLLDRIDGLERDVAAVRSRLLSASRTTVVVAPDRRGPRILQLPELVPVDASLAALDADDVTFVIDLTESPTSTTLSAESLDESSELIDVIEIDDDFPTVEVVGEFSLEGLTLFRRPAGMPERFPSVEGAAEAATAASTDVVDLRRRAPKTA